MIRAVAEIEKTSEKSLKKGLQNNAEDDNSIRVPESQ